MIQSNINEIAGSSYKPFIAKVINEFAQVLKRNNVTNQIIQIEVVEKDDFECGAIFGNIIISTAAFESIWRLTFYYIALYENYFQGTSKYTYQVKIPIDWKYKFLEQIRKNAFNSKYCASLLNPMQRSRLKERNIVIKKTAMYAALFFLLHEFKHLTDNNGKPKNKNEEVCDNFASDILCSERKNKTSSQIEYIETGLCIGLFAISAMGVNCKFFDGITHPKTYVRLRNVLKNHFDEKADSVWAFAMMFGFTEFMDFGYSPNHKKIYNDFMVPTLDLIAEIESEQL